MGEIRRYTVHLIDGSGEFVGNSFEENKDSWYWHVGDHGGLNDSQIHVVCVAMERVDVLNRAIQLDNLPAPEARKARSIEGRTDVYVMPKNDAVNLGVKLNDMGF